MGMGQWLFGAWSGRKTASTSVVEPVPADLDGSPPQPPPPPENAAALQLSREILRGLEQFVLSTPDLDTPAFLNEVRSLSAQLKPGIAADDLRLIRSWAASDGPRFGQQQRGYLADREEELWRLLAIYQEHQRIGGISNRQFHDILRNLHERLSLVARLSDIQQVRERLEAEVARASTLVERKREQDDERCGRLKEHVEKLEAALARAEERARQDPLTGVHHRGAFQAELEAVLASGIPVSLAIADLDGFKQVNDRFGHLCGDRVLKQAVQLLARMARPGEVVGRFGGDEFCLLAPNVSAERLADRFSAITTARTVCFEHEGSVETVRICFSVGIADSRPDETAESLFQRADRALYAAKAEGRGAVHTASA